MRSGPRPSLVIAIDDLKANAWDWALDVFSGLPVVLKAGAMLIPKLSVKSIGRARDLGFGVFVDLKLHDIPSQVRGAVEAWQDAGASALTLHVSGGRRMLEAATQGRGNGSMHLLGVSVLTSLSETEWQEGTGATCTLVSQVQRCATLAAQEGLDAVVCAVPEVSMVHEVSKGRLWTVTPGLHVEGEGASDQVRSATWKDALSAGATWLVMGRSILGSANPRASAELVCNGIKELSK